MAFNNITKVELGLKILNEKNFLSKKEREQYIENDMAFYRGFLASIREKRILHYTIEAFLKSQEQYAFIESEKSEHAKELKEVYVASLEESVKQQDVTSYTTNLPFITPLTEIPVLQSSLTHLREALNTTITPDMSVDELIKIHDDIHNKFATARIELLKQKYPNGIMVIEGHIVKIPAEGVSISPSPTIDKYLKYSPQLKQELKHSNPTQQEKNLIVFCSGASQQQEMNDELIRVNIFRRYNPHLSIGQAIKAVKKCKEVDIELYAALYKAAQEKAELVVNPCILHHLQNFNVGLQLVGKEMQTEMETLKELPALAYNFIKKEVNLVEEAVNKLEVSDFFQPDKTPKPG